MSDPEFTAVRRPFDAAFLRMRQAGDVDLLRDELSNMLQHLYRLGELRRRRWQLKRNDHERFNAKAKVVPGALGAMWIRTFDTHELFSLSMMSDLYSDFFSDLYGVSAWKPVAAIVSKPPGGWALVRYEDYQAHLENKPVLDTMRRAFDGLASLL